MRYGQPIAVGPATTTTFFDGQKFLRLKPPDGLLRPSLGHPAAPCDEPYAPLGSSTSRRRKVP